MRKYLKILLGLFRLLKYIILNSGNLKIHGYRYFIGSQVKFWIHSGGTCDLGTKSWLSEFCFFEANAGKIKLGHNNFFNSNCRLVSMNEIVIGDNNLFGPNVVIVDHKHNYEDPNTLICNQGITTSPIKIGSDNWICSNVVITDGVTIADHIVVASNSVVNKDLVKPGVYAGTPAKLIKERKLQNE
nr:acyltransferase [Lysinibacillus timonensis]